MAKRVSQEERPYRPVEEALIRSVMDHRETEQGIDPLDVAGPERTDGPLNAASDESGVEEGVSPSAEQDDQGRAPTLTEEKLTREKRVLLTFSEEREVERLVSRVAEELATPVKLSHMLRAYITLLLHAENEITKRARQAAPLHRPSNGDPVALVQFEQSLAQILSAAFRNAPPLR